MPALRATRAERCGLGRRPLDAPGHGRLGLRLVADLGTHGTVAPLAVLTHLDLLLLRRRLAQDAEHEGVLDEVFDADGVEADGTRHLLLPQVHLQKALQVEAVEVRAGAGAHGVLHALVGERVQQRVPEAHRIQRRAVLVVLHAGDEGRLVGLDGGRRLVENRLHAGRAGERLVELGDDEEDGEGGAGHGQTVRARADRRL